MYGMELLGILGIVIGTLFLAALSADMLAWPIGELFLWTQKRLGFPRNVKTGAEGLIGQTATVIRPFAWDEQKKCRLGKVRLNGEVWWARIIEAQATQVQQGAYVQVEGVDGLVLLVCTAEKASRLD
jgi:membrane protein implicated in regulation of membrane protease activity